MPAQVQKAPSGFLAAAKAHAKDETRQPRDFSELPGGITNGVAILTEAKRGVYKKSAANDKNGLTGKPFLFLAATVESPRTAVEAKRIWDAALGGPRVMEAREVNTFGLKTTKTLPLVQSGSGDKIKTQEENIAEALNYLRIVGGDSVTEPLTHCKTEAEAEQVFDAILAALKKAKPKIRFNTRWKDPIPEHPNGGTWPHDWFTIGASPNGQLPHAETTEEAGVDDQTGGEAPAEGEAPTEEGAAAEGDAPDLAALLTAANEGSDEEKEAATNELIALAVAAGHDQETVEGAESWEAVVAMIENPYSEPAAPQVGEVYRHQPTDPKTGKPLTDPKTKKARAKVSCTVESVDEEKKTVVLKSNVDKKTKWTVPWDKLTVE